MEDILRNNSSKAIRFIFCLDESGPDFDSTNEFYAEQLRKNIFLNIYKNGEWGTITNIFIDSYDLSLDKKYTNFINTLTLDGLKVKYLGINSKNISVNYTVNNELGPLEYSGITAHGKKIMGIAPFNNNSSKKLLPDPYLSWIIPSDWSLEDAVTVPLSYSMAYYILTEVITSTTPEKLSNKSILIHAGFNAIGQAAISICLAEGYMVYTTVKNEEQAKLLKKKFPLLPESRIYSYENIDFEIKIKIATGGDGVTTILNCLDGDEFNASLQSISMFGHFVQLSKVDMINKKELGLYIFLNVIAFYTISLNSLLEASNDIKLRVQNKVQKGIELGIVKPSDRNVLTGHCTEEEAIKALNLSSQEIESKRVVVSLKEEKVNKKDLSLEKYQCQSNRSYLIVGNEHNTWIDLFEWLLLRGARKVIVAINKYTMSTIVSRKFNLLMKKYQNVIIQIVSDSTFNSKEDLINLLEDLTAKTSLGGIFFATMNDDREKLKNIQYAVENLSSAIKIKPSFIICIMSGGDEICTELKAKNICLNAFSISWNSLITQPKFSDYIPSFDKVLLNADNIHSSIIKCSEHNKELTGNKDMYFKILAELPESIEELFEFEENLSEEPEFVEIGTKSRRFSDTPDSLPVFVVRGFRSKKMKKLYENLLYPVFEARLPEDIDSIENIATQLVQKLKKITKCGTVPLIGISWGGAVCILMAQMLEAENIPVSLTLFDGIPETFQTWANSLKQYGNFNSKLVLHYFQINNAVAKKIALKSSWDAELPEILSSNNIPKSDFPKILKALNAISSRLNAIFTIKPLTVKIKARVKIINRSDNIVKARIQDLVDYCTLTPEKYTVNNKDMEKHVCKIINCNVIHYHPDADKVSIQDVYSRSERTNVGSNIF